MKNKLGSSRRKTGRERGKRYSAVPSLQEAGSDFSARSTRSREVDGFNFYFQLLHNAARSCWYVSGERAASPGLSFEASSFLLFILFFSSFLPLPLLSPSFSLLVLFSSVPSLPCIFFPLTTVNDHGATCKEQFSISINWSCRKKFVLFVSFNENNTKTSICHSRG